MSWQIAADIREMFVEVVATGDSQTFCVRSLNRKDQLLSGFTEALNVLSEHFSAADASLTVRSDWERVALREHWGGHGAFLTTEGFENLLELGDQRRKNKFGLHAERSVPLIARDLSFGVTERTLSDGTVEMGLDDKEIEFVLSKLALAEIKAVAICFLHSNINPTHEKQVAARLREKGYEVFPSYEYPGNERQRALRAVEKAYTFTGQKTLLEDLQKLGFDEKNISIKTTRPKAPSETLLCDFLEDRILLRWNEGGGEKLVELSLSPLSQILLEEGKMVHVGPEKIDSEPGPVVFSKGITLSLLDLLAHKSKLTASQLPRLKLETGRVLKQLVPMAKQLQLDPETCSRNFIKLAYDLIALEFQYHLRKTKTRGLALECGGWLAPLMGPPLARRVDIGSFLVRKNSQWSNASELTGSLAPVTITAATGSLTFEEDSVTEPGARHG